MRYRVVRLMVLFDLPVDSREQRREYRRFRKALIREGFFMMQYSNYVRVCPSKNAANFLVKRISEIAPREGLIQSLIITEAQYQAMNFISGTASTDIRNSAERTIIL